VILTVDVGTSATKVALWGRDGLVALAGRSIPTTHPEPGWSEQDPRAWWASVVAACDEVNAQAPTAFGSVDAVGCTGARQTFALVDATGDPLGSGIVWSDRRASAEATALVRRLGERDRGGPGMPLDAASVSAKIAWLATHDRDRLRASTWILTPRDLVVWRLTGAVATDPTMASSSGLYDVDGHLMEAVAGEAAGRLARVVPSDQVTGKLTEPAASQLGLTAGIPVVIGAGDRPCEVLGTGATDSSPMVSWGTTANVSVPVGDRPVEVPGGVVVSRGANGGWLLEGGLSSAGSFVAWLGRLTGRSGDELATLAGQSPPGARGLVATPWLEGARAPWWEQEAGAAFVGLQSAHDVPDLARAVFESVAWEVERCLEAICSRQPGGPGVTRLALTGAGASTPVWREVLTAVTGLPARCRRSGQAASMGAAMLAAAAVGVEMSLDVVDPVDVDIEPNPSMTLDYSARRQQVDRVASSLIDLARASTVAPSVETGDPTCG